MKKELKVVGHGVSLDYSDMNKAGLDLLNHPRLESDPIFKSLKTDLEHYYSNTQDLKKLDKLEPKARLHSALYTNLHSLLSEVTYTKDQTMQKQMLHTIHNWYIKKTPHKHRLPSIQYSHSHAKSHLEEKALSTAAETSENQSFYVNRSPSPYFPMRNQSSDLNFSAQISENLDSRYLEMRKNDFKTKKESENKHRVIAQWGTEKSRAASDQTQKFEQTKIAYRRPESPQFVQLRHANYKSSQLTDSKRYDFSINKSVHSELKSKTPEVNRISKLRKLHASLLDIENEFQVPKKKKTEISMSLYKNESFDGDERNRAMSSGMVNDQYGEVMVAKSRLASRNVACPVRYLIDGLILPQDGPRAASPEGLPRGGEYLISNPLLKLGKKKKKGKKKGKKKKKA